MWNGIVFGFSLAFGVWLFVAILRMIGGAIEGGIKGWRESEEKPKVVKARRPWRIPHADEYGNPVGWGH